MKRKKRILHTFVPVLAGFAALYLVLMTLSTFLVKEKFMESFETDYNAAIAETEETIRKTENDEEWLANGNTKDAVTRYNYVLNSILIKSGSKYFQCSGALFDKEKNLLAKSRNLLTFMMPGENLYYNDYPVDDYLSQDELKELAHYVELQRTGFLNKLPGISSSKAPAIMAKSPFAEYRITMAMLRGTDVPAQIIVQEMNWKVENVIAENSSSENSTVVWVWTNPDIQISKEPQNHFFELEAYPGSSFPYLSYGYQSWLAWQENDFLQDLRLDKKLFYTLPQYNAAADPAPPFRPQTKRISEIYISADDRLAGSYFLIAAIDCHPWLAAMDDMKYFYLLGFACMLICVCILTFAISRTNRRRDALEENRRDFTNAMAHELKTPLCVIRGAAENLKENTVEEKREHYLDKVILKTEEMDALVAEMIYVSRLESENLILKKELVYMNELVETQLKKLSVVISNKNLSLLYQPDEQFCVTGDRQYLEKAIWNLLSNAAAYNIENGHIRITIKKELCSIENTGAKIPENDLPHIFEMFYRGEAEQADEEKHLGMGLYLARKICTLHHLTLSIQNTEIGVRADISL